MNYSNLEKETTKKIDILMFFSLQPIQEERNQIKDNLELTRLWGILSKWVHPESPSQVGQNDTEGKPAFLDPPPPQNLSKQEHCWLAGESIVPFYSPIPISKLILHCKILVSNSFTKQNYSPLNFSFFKYEIKVF